MLCTRSERCEHPHLFALPLKGRQPVLEITVFMGQKRLAPRVKMLYVSAHRLILQAQLFQSPAHVPVNDWQKELSYRRCAPQSLVIQKDTSVHVNQRDRGGLSRDSINTNRRGRGGVI